MPGLTCPTWPGVGRLFELLLDPRGHFCRHGAHPSKPRSKTSSWTLASPWLPSLGLWRRYGQKYTSHSSLFLHRKMSWDTFLTASLHFCSCFRSNKIVLSMRGLSNWKMTIPESLWSLQNAEARSIRSTASSNSRCAMKTCKNKRSILNTYGLDVSCDDSWVNAHTLRAFFLSDMEIFEKASHMWDVCIMNFSKGQ